MRLIDADKLYPDCMTKDGKLAISQSQLANAPVVEVPENAVNCVLTMFGECSYNETGCHDCEIKDKIRKALSKRPTDEWIRKEEALKIMCEKCPVYNCVSACNSYRSIEKMSFLIR